MRIINLKADDFIEELNQVSNAAGRDARESCSDAGSVLCLAKFTDD